MFEYAVYNLIAELTAKAQETKTFSLISVTLQNSPLQLTMQPTACGIFCLKLSKTGLSGFHHFHPHEVKDIK